MKLKDLIDKGIIKVQVKCGKCGFGFNGKCKICPKCGYRWTEEIIKEAV